MFSKPLIIGHRGASASAPENTLAAFRLALENGADGIEFDVRLTADGVPVVIHDDNLQRTGATRKRVSDLSLAELKQIDVGSWFSRSFAAERIPTLEELMKLVDGSSAILYLEMKSDPAQLPQLVNACCTALKGSSLKNRVIVECFNLEGIAKVKKVDPELKTAALFEPQPFARRLLTSGRRMVEQTRAVGAEQIALHYRLASARVVATAKNHGLEVAVWTVGEGKWIQRAAKMGIVSLITNDPATMVRQRNEAGAD